MKKILILMMLLFSHTIFADVNAIQKNRGKYYEVHRNEDGSYTYFFIPHFDTAVSVSGLKLDKAVLGFFGIQGSKTRAGILKKALESGKIHAEDPVVMFTVDTSTVDQLFLRYSQLAKDGKGRPMPGGSIYHTDLLWLINEAKRSGRYVEHYKD